MVSGSPAAKAGLVQGDVIVNIDGTAITSAEDLQNTDPEVQGRADGDDHLLRRRQQADDDRHAGQPAPGAAAAVAVTGSDDQPLRRGRVPRLRQLRDGDRARRPSSARPTLPAAPGCRSSGPGAPAGSSWTRRRLPPARLDVLEDVRHVVRVLLVGELPVAGVDQARVAGLAVRRPVGLEAGHDLGPLHDDVVPLDRRELDRELPVLHARAWSRPASARWRPALDPPPGPVDVHGVVGVEVGQGAERVGLEPLVDPPAQLVVAVDGRLAPPRVETAWSSSSLGVRSRRRPHGTADPARLELRERGGRGRRNPRPRPTSPVRGPCRC